MTIAEKLTINQIWGRRASRRSPHRPLYVVKQVHRKDRQAQLVGTEGKFYVAFSELRAKWELVA